MFFQFKLKKVQLIVYKLQGVQVKAKKSQKNTCVVYRYLKKSAVTKHIDKTPPPSESVCDTHVTHFCSCHLIWSSVWFRSPRGLDQKPGQCGLDQAAGSLGC